MEAVRVHLMFPQDFNPIKSQTQPEEKLFLSCSESELCHTPVPGPCDPDDLIDGIIFAANYLGSTQLLSDKTPSKNIRMMQAQEAVSRIKVKTHIVQTQTHCSVKLSAQSPRLSNSVSVYINQPKHQSQE